MNRILSIAMVVVLGGLAAGIQAQNATWDAPAAVQSRFYQEGNKWVEEVTGMLTPGKGFKLMTDVGSIEIEGAAQPN
ncbi:MAG: hypothetical protein ACRD2Y_12820, partial [Terriglobales bacterium]